METRSYQVYKFNELPDDIKQKAIQNLYDINVTHDWWEFTYEDAARIGLEITEFDTDRANHINGNLTLSVRDSIRAIWDQHGLTCGTSRAASSWWYLLAKGHDRDTEEELNDDYKRDMLGEYLSILRQEYEWLTSDRQIIETIEANDYDFTMTGQID